MSTTEQEFTEADERAWVAFAAARLGMDGCVTSGDAAVYADQLLDELRRRRQPERKEGPYR